MSYLFTGPDALTPWIENSTAAAIRGNPVEARVKLVQVVDIVTTRPPCYRIHDGEYSILAYLVSPKAQESVAGTTEPGAFSNTTTGPRPTVGCILKIQDWKVSTQNLVIRASQTSENSSNDANRSLVPCLAIYGRVEHQGGDGIGVSGRLEDIYNSASVRQELHSIQYSQSTLHHRLRKQWLEEVSPSSSPMRLRRQQQQMMKTNSAAGGNNNNRQLHNNNNDTLNVNSNNNTATGRAPAPNPESNTEDVPIGNVEALFESGTRGQQELQEILDRAAIFPRNERPENNDTTPKHENGFTVYTIGSEKQVAYVVRDQTHMQDLFTDVLNEWERGRPRAAIRATTPAAHQRQQQQLTNNASPKVTPADAAADDRHQPNTNATAEATTVDDPGDRQEHNTNASPVVTNIDTAVPTNREPCLDVPEGPASPEGPQTQGEQQEPGRRPDSPDGLNNDKEGSTTDNDGGNVDSHVGTPVSSPLSSQVESSVYGTPRSREEQNGISNMLCDDSQSEEEEDYIDGKSSANRQRLHKGKRASGDGAMNETEKEATQAAKQGQPLQQQNEEQLDVAELDEFLESHERELHSDDSSDRERKRRRQSDNGDEESAACILDGSSLPMTPAANVVVAGNSHCESYNRAGRQDTIDNGQVDENVSGVDSQLRPTTINAGESEHGATGDTEPTRETESASGATKRRPPYLQKFLRNVERSLGSSGKRQRFNPPPLKSVTNPPPFGNRVRSWLHFWKNEIPKK